MVKKKLIKIYLTKKVISKLQSFFEEGQSLEAFIETQILKMAIARELEAETSVAQRQIESVQKSLREKSEKLTKELLN